jgi:hypothetical protein
MSEFWEETDDSIYLVHNFTDVRVQIDVSVNNGDSWDLVGNDTIAESPDDW